jgi:hypothetical protein
LGMNTPWLIDPIPETRRRSRFIYAPPPQAA